MVIIRYEKEGKRRGKKGRERERGKKNIKCIFVNKGEGVSSFNCMNSPLIMCYQISILFIKEDLLYKKR